MTPYLTCDAALELLEPFVDGELAMADQVAVESHLRWCRVCEARVSDMQLIGGSLRLVGHAAPLACGDARDLATIQSSVLARVRAERDQSWPVRFRSLFVDMRLFWPALGAVIAVAICFVGATGVLAMATDQENQDSMAAMIETLANPGSDRNPMALGSSVFAPRAIDAGLVFDSIMEGDAVYALSAVVTQEGRITNSELLLSERASIRRRDTAAERDSEAAALLAAVNRSRFKPAQSRDGRRRVAVNVVWLLERTTVKGTPAAAARAELALPRPVVVPMPEPGEPEPPAEEGVEPAGRQSSDARGSTTA
jgi:hypothetical protein